MKTNVFQNTVHLEEYHLLPPEKACPFCLNVDRKSVGFLQKEPDVLLLLCKNCYAGSASRMPKKDALDNYYSNYYKDREVKVTVDDPYRFASHIFTYAKWIIKERNVIKGAIQILDFGGGDGSISTIIAQKMVDRSINKVEITLADYHPECKKADNRNIEINQINDLSQVRDESCDLVIASGVIEHIPEPREVLEKLFRVIKKGGIFYARTPYILPFLLMSNIIGFRFDSSYPAHVHDLGAMFWNRLTHRISPEGGLRVLRSTPSIVETSFKRHLLITLAAYMLKAPGYIFKESYRLVGGWEVFIRRD